MMARQLIKTLLKLVRVHGDKRIFVIDDESGTLKVVSDVDLAETAGGFVIIASR